jgi:hypothetical protein
MNDEQELKVIRKEWRSAAHTIGFIAYETGFEDQWNAVVGYAPDFFDLGGLGVPTMAGNNSDADAQYIARNGAKLSWQEAHVIFPSLDIKKHKYYQP